MNTPGKITTDDNSVKLSQGFSLNVISMSSGKPASDIQISRQTAVTTVGQQQAASTPGTRVLAPSVHVSSCIPVFSTSTGMSTPGPESQSQQKPVTIAVSTISSMGTPLASRPLTATIPLQVVPSHIPIPHVPRGPAAVANIATPRTSVAAPIVRVTSNVQTTGVSVPAHQTSFVSGLRGTGPRTLTPVVGATWVSGSIQSTTGIPRATVFATRPASMTVTARPIGIQVTRMPSETPRAQIVNPPGVLQIQKPLPAQQTIAIAQATPSPHITEKGFFKQTMSVQSSMGPVTIAQLVPTRPQGLTYTNPLASGTQALAAPRPSAVPTSRQAPTPSRIAVPTQGVTAQAIPVPTQGVAVPGSGVARLAPGAVPVPQTQHALLTSRARLAGTQPRNSFSNPTVIATMPSTVITAPTRMAVPAAGVVHQAGAMLGPQTKLTISAAAPSPGLQTASVVSIQPVVVSAANASMSIKTTHAPQVPNPALSRVITAPHNASHKVMPQALHGPSIQLAQVQTGATFSAKLQPQALHSVVPLTQAALAITTIPNRPAVPLTTTAPALAMSNIRPITMTAAPSTGRVFSQQSVAEISVPVHAIHPQPATQSLPAAQQNLLQGTNIYIQTSHSNRHPTVTNANPVYFYDSAYQVAGISGPIVARPYQAPANSFTSQSTAIQGHQVHGTTTFMTSGAPLRFNPLVVMDPGRSSTTMPVHTYSAEGGLLQTDPSAVTASPNHVQALTKPNASPRPSILRKRDNEGSPMKAQKNLTPLLSSLGGGPSPPPSPRRPDSHDNGGSSNGSTTISATSSPGLAEGGDDSQPASIKQEQADEVERPPVEMSPRKKPRKQQLTGNELHEPKFSEDDMEFISDEKGAKELSEAPEQDHEEVYVPKRPKVSLRNSYRHTWKSQHNHFVHYENVKAKDTRPTISELANQKGIMEKLNGWKIFHLSTQMEEMSDLETNVVERLTSTLKVMEVKVGKDVDKDINRINELIKGNIQRSKVIRDQMQDALSQVMKVFDHKDHVTNILARCPNKRTLKKREKS